MQRFRLKVQDGPLSNSLDQIEASFGKELASRVTGREVEVIPDTRELRDALAQIDHMAAQIRAAKGNPPNGVALLWSGPLRISVDNQCPCPSCTEKRQVVAEAMKLGMGQPAAAGGGGPSLKVFPREEKDWAAESRGLGLPGWLPKAITAVAFVLLFCVQPLNTTRATCRRFWRWLRPAKVKKDAA